MADVSWLNKLMDENDISVSELAEQSGVSGPGIYQILKRGSCRDSTAKKLQSVFDERIGPYLSVRDGEVEAEEGMSDLLDLPETSLEAALKRFKGKDCPNPSAECASCYNVLSEASSELSRRLPETRAQCRLEHGWKLNRGMIEYNGDS